MKKYLFALLAGAALFAGCEKAQEQELTEVSFETAIPIVSDDGVATFSLVSDYAGTETVKVPVKFSSSNGAVQGTDYTVSAEEFVLGGTAPVSKITVTPLIYGSKKDITAEITIPEGFKAGKYVKSTFTVSDKLGYVSFSSKKAIMTETATFSINVLNENGADKKVNENTEFTVLHCNTQYPTEDSDMNILAINELKASFPKWKVGLSDHSEGIVAALVSVGMGASFIEKHFTLDKEMEGPDHKASITPNELKRLCYEIHRAEVMLGTGIKAVTKSEEDNRKIARKSIVASRNIKMGEILTEENLTCKRPGTGINPMKWDSVLGKTAEMDFSVDELIICKGIEWEYE